MEPIQQKLLFVLSEGRYNLYLGTLEEAQSMAVQVRYSITSIITLSSKITVQILKQKINHIVHKYDENNASFQYINLFNIVTEDMYQGLQKGNVIVHCNSFDQNASSSSCIGYLMRYKAINYEKAFYQIKGLKRSICPSVNFKKHLFIYQNDLKNSPSNKLQSSPIESNLKKQDQLLDSNTTSRGQNSRQNISSPYLFDFSLNLSQHLDEKDKEFSFRNYDPNLMENQTSYQNITPFSLQYNDQVEPSHVPTFNFKNISIKNGQQTAFSVQKKKDQSRVIQKSFSLNQSFAKNSDSQDKQSFKILIDQPNAQLSSSIDFDTQNTSVEKEVISKQKTENTKIIVANQSSSLIIGSKETLVTDKPKIIVLKKISSKTLNSEKSIPDSVINREIRHSVIKNKLGIKLIDSVEILYPSSPKKVMPEVPQSSNLIRLSKSQQLSTEKEQQWRNPEIQLNLITKGILENEKNNFRWRSSVQNQTQNNKSSLVKDSCGSLGKSLRKTSAQSLYKDSYQI